MKTRDVVQRSASDESDVSSTDTEPKVSPLPRPGILMCFRNALARWYRQYELTLCINMFEPWEKTLLNTLVGGTSLLVGYSSIVYLPAYLTDLVGKIRNIILQD